MLEIRLTQGGTQLRLTANNLGNNQLAFAEVKSFHAAGDKKLGYLNSYFKRNGRKITSSTHRWVAGVVREGTTTSRGSATYRHWHIVFAENPGYSGSNVADPQPPRCGFRKLFFVRSFVGTPFLAFCSLAGRFPTAVVPGFSRLNARIYIRRSGGRKFSIVAYGSNAAGGSHFGFRRALRPDGGHHGPALIAHGSGFVPRIDQLRCPRGRARAGVRIRIRHGLNARAHAAARWCECPWRAERGSAAALRLRADGRR